MSMKGAFQAVILSSVVCSAVSDAAADLEAQKAALNAISSFASDLCKEPPLAGTASQYELSGEAKAELSKVLKKVVDLGIKGAAKYQGSAYEGLLQEDLAALVKDSSNCRLEVWRDLKDKLIPTSDVKEPFMGELLWDTNLQGHDIANIDRPDVNTAGECSEQCLKNHQCKAMTFVRHPSQPGGICWLKNAVPPSSPASSMASAIKVFP